MNYQKPTRRRPSAEAPGSARFGLNSTPGPWAALLLAAAHDHGLVIPIVQRSMRRHRDAPERLPTRRDVPLHFLLEFLGALGLNNEIPHSLTSPKVTSSWKALD